MKKFDKEILAILNKISEMDSIIYGGPSLILGSQMENKIPYRSSIDIDIKKINLDKISGFDRSVKENICMNFDIVSRDVIERYLGHSNVGINSETSSHIDSIDLFYKKNFLTKSNLKKLEVILNEIL